MKRKTLLNTGLILAFLCCYTEWGQNKSMFVAGAVYEILRAKDHFWQNLTHPLILAGFSGIFLLLYCAFSRTPVFWLNLCGILLLGIIVVLFLVAGVLSGNFKMILSTLPYLTVSFLFFRWKQRQKKGLPQYQRQ